MSQSPKAAGRRLHIHGAITFGATTLVNVLNYLFHVLGSRWLGPVGYGEVAALLNVLALASIPAAILQLIVAKLVAELRVAAAEHPVGEFERRVRTVYDRIVRRIAWASLAILCAGWLLVGPLAQFLAVRAGLAVALTIVVVASNLVLTSIRGILQGSERFGVFSASLAIEAVGKGLLGLALIALGFGVPGALGGYAIGSAASMLFTSIAIARMFPEEASQLHVDLRRLWQSSQGIAATQACLTVLGFSDIVVVKHFFAPAEAGIYSAIALSGKVLLFLVAFVPLLVLPRAAARRADEQSSHEILLVAGGFLVLAAGTVLAAFALFPTAVVRAMAGSAFLGAAPYIAPYGLAMTLLAATQILTTYNVGRHRFRFVLPFAAVTLAELAALIFAPHHIEAIVRVLLIGNALGLVASLTALGKTTHAAHAVGREARV